VVVSQEYGGNLEEKLAIARGICSSLICKIRWDLQTGADVHLNGEGNAHHRVLHRLDSTEFEFEDLNEVLRHVRTRLYFTSESHIVSLFNILLYGGDGREGIVCPEARRAIHAGMEYSYLSHIIIKMWEDPSQIPGADERFKVNIQFSMGASSDVLDPGMYDQDRTIQASRTLPPREPLSLTPPSLPSHSSSLGSS